MKKFKLDLSRFDIGIIIAFAVIGLMGGGAWWYLSSALQTAQQQDLQVKSDFDNNAVKGNIIVNAVNAKTLQENGDLIKTQVDPLISRYFLAKDNKISDIAKEDPVAWKHDLDEDVRALTSDAKGHGVTLPASNFYFGFSRYLTESPNDEATTVLSKQRLAIKAISEILINGKVTAIDRVRRTYEEDPRPVNAGTSASDHAEGDQLGGFSIVMPGETYTAYPFEFEFDTKVESLRPVIDELVKSPYLFIVRTVEVDNAQLTSPVTGDLDRMAQVTPGAPSAIDAGPGGVAASAPPTVGPQYLFGNSVLHVKIRVDLIEWNPALKSVALTVPPPAKH